MHSNRREVAFSKKLVELSGTESALDEDDDLIKFKTIEEVVKFAILFSFTELDAVLLKTMQSELGLIVNVNFKRITHELLADGSDLLRQCGAEHHHLLLRRCGSEDFLNVAAHV